MSFPSSTPSNRNLVIAHLQGSDQTVLRDVTDIDHPATIATLDTTRGWGGDGWANPAFASASSVSYQREGDAHFYRVQVSGSGSYTLSVGCQDEYLVAFRWSPDGQSLTYIAEHSVSSYWNRANAFEWHLVSRGIDRVVGTAPAWCRCGNGSEDYSLDEDFSPDGQSVSLVDSLGVGTNLQVRRLDGTLVGAEIRGDATFPNSVTHGVWSGTDLFYRDSQGVERWHDGTAKSFLPGVAWIHPRASPAGGQIVYAARGSDGQARISVANTATGQSRQLSSRAATWPIFLTPRYIWYRGERPCGPSDAICIKAAFTGKTYVYDLQTGAEWESIITDVADVWPHGN